MDTPLKLYATEILNVFQYNAMKQRIWGTDTVLGKFEALPTLLGLIVLSLYDRIFGTRLSGIG